MNESLPEAVSPLTGADAGREVLRALVDSSWNVLIVLDDSCHVLAMNEAARATFDAVDAFHGSLLVLTGSAELETMVSEAVRNKERILEEQLRLNDCWWRVRVQISRGTAQETLICLALEDVSQLVRLNRARRDMVANISHELRTPIANIRLIIDGLFLDNERPRRKHSIRSLQAIGREADALQWMSEELLDLSMIESGQALMKMVDTPAREVVLEAIERMANFSEAKEAPVVQKIPDDLYILCDPDKLRRVLMNLLHNALKWSPPGKKIRVVAKRDGDEVLFGVFDRGAGVPEEHTGRIFERFYQVDPSRSDSEGTGIGLAICRHIIEAHGGHIRAESNVTRDGGRFYFTIPVGARS